MKVVSSHKCTRTITVYNNVKSTKSLFFKHGDPNELGKLSVEKDEVLISKLSTSGCGTRSS